MMKDRLELDSNYAPTAFVFYDQEVKALWRILERHYIPYDDTEAQNAVTKLGKMVNELASASRKST